MISAESTLAEAAEQAVLSGAVESIVFHNDENGFCVLRLEVDDHPDLVTVVGSVAEVAEGEQLQAQGRWVKDPRFGWQLRAEQLQPVVPTSRLGIERYLASGAIKGIGPHLAKRLIEAFGEDVFDVIEKTPDRLKALHGIGEKRVVQITEAWDAHRVVREIMVFLQSHGIGTARAVRIYKTYGEAAIAIVRENPYRLALDVRGIGFQIADQLAQRLGIPRNSPMRAQAGVRHVLQELTVSGHCAAHFEQLADASVRLLGIARDIIVEAIETEVEARRMIAEPEGESTLLYPPRLFFSERGVANALLALRNGPPPWGNIELSQAVAAAESATGLRLANSQRNAITLVSRNKLAILTGGPGVGKTTVVNTILKIVESSRIKISLCAPTGRAAKRLSESTGREAKTIHRLLRVDPAGGFQHNRDNPLDTDFVVCDEVSMVDIALMDSLLQAIPPHAAVLLVGDVDQLPSVGPGAVLADMIASGVIPTVRLHEIFRQASTSRIIVNAHKINAGEVPQSPNPQPLDSDWYLIRCANAKSIQDRLIDVVAERIPSRFGFHPVRDVQVLTPMHRGELGTQTLNTLLQARLNPNAEPRLERFGWVFSPGDKVIQTANNYDKDVFNGDIGWVLDIDTSEKQVRIAFDQRHVIYDYSELDEVALAYATSVHKAQGSEYPVVVMPLSLQHHMLLQRNLLYTGVTRGKQLVVLLAEDRALSKAIANTGKGRLTRLQERLVEAF